MRVRIPCLFEIRGSIRDIFFILLRKEAVLLIEIFNNYLRLRSTTTPPGELHGAIAKCIYNSKKVKVHLITAISSFKGIQAVRIEFFCLY